MSITSRRHLQTAIAGRAASSGEPISGDPTSHSLGTIVILIIAVILCVLTFALLLDVIVRFVVRFSGPIKLDLSTSVHQVIQKLPVVIHGSECAICLDQLEPGERVRFMPNCGHGFHVHCIDRWLVVRLSCPTCRQTSIAAGREKSKWDEPEKAVWRSLNLQIAL